MTKKRRALISFIALPIAGGAFAGTYCVHYTCSGSGRDITVQAESSAEAVAWSWPCSLVPS